MERKSDRAWSDEVGGLVCTVYIVQYTHVKSQALGAGGILELLRVQYCALTHSRHVNVHPHLHMATADRALLHLSRAIAARALVAAWHCDVRFGVGEAGDAR